MDAGDVITATVASGGTGSNITATRGSDLITDVAFEQRIVEATILSVISCVALVGNTSLWLVICGDRVLRTNSNALILCLSTADLLVSAINMPMAVVAILYGRWFLSHGACVVLGFITMCTFIASVMSLGVISINRFVLICYPAHFKSVYTQSRTGLMIAGTWTLSIVLAHPPLIGWGVYDYLPGQSFCFCNWKTSFSYTIFMVVVCFGGPCSIMTFSYVGILRKVRASRRRIKNSPSQIPSQTSIPTKLKSKTHSTNVRNKQLSSMSDVITSDGKSDQNQPGTSGVTNSSNNNVQPPSQPQPAQKAAMRRGQQEELRLTVTLLVVISVFVVSWLPFCITMFLSVFSPYPVPRIPDILTLLLGCFNSSCNPIIYGLMNKRFWDGYKKLYCCLCRRKWLGNSESDQNTGHT